MDLFAQLNDIAERKESGARYPLYVKNKTYHLCMEERFLSVFLSMWMEAYKPFPFSVRDASKGVEGSVVVSVTDHDGEMIDFLTRAVRACSPRVVAK